MGASSKDQKKGRGFTKELGTILGRMASLCIGQAIEGGYHRNGADVARNSLQRYRTTVGQRCIEIVILALMTLLTIF